MRPSAVLRLVHSRWVAAAVAVAGCLAAGHALRGSLPRPADIAQALIAADRGWLAVAVAAEFASMAMFAVLQRRLLRAFGGSMTVRDALLVTFARTGISVALPAGAAVSTGYALRHYRRRGVSVPGAVAVTVLAGVQSVAALLLIYVGWFAAVGLGATGTAGRAALGMCTVAVTGVAAIVVPRRPIGAMGERVARRWRTGDAVPPRWRWVPTVADAVTGAVRDAASLSSRDWAIGAATALGNWLLDLGCLLTVARACGLPTGVVSITGAYLLVQVVRQVPITPGGVGVVEAGLLVGLVAAGATGGTAAAVVLVYRLLSCWLMAPIGLLAAVALRAGDGARGRLERPDHRGTPTFRGRADSHGSLIAAGSPSNQALPARHDKEAGDRP